MTIAGVHGGDLDPRRRSARSGARALRGRDDARGDRRGARRLRSDGDADRSAPRLATAASPSYRQAGIAVDGKWVERGPNSDAPPPARRARPELVPMAARGIGILDLVLWSGGRARRIVLPLPSGEGRRTSSRRARPRSSLGPPARVLEHGARRGVRAASRTRSCRWPVPSYLPTKTTRWRHTPSPARGPRRALVAEASVK
jgi:hypothetical protein